jgi:hypothetical protein
MHGHRTPPPRIPGHSLRHFLLATACLLASALWLSAQSLPSSKASEAFTVTGTVVNSVTGEPLGHALVRINGGMLQRTCFADGEGHFQFDGVTGNSLALTAQKPGYFGDEELPAHSVQFVSVGPNSNSVVLKLSPSSAIVGRILDAADQPVEHMPVQLANRNVRDGRRRLELRGSQQTDEDGKFRFANLMPGSYYLMAGPGTDDSRLLAEGQLPKTGYPSVYYPGVPTLASASPLQLTAGQQAQADLSISAVPVYHISGLATGFSPAQGVGLQFFSQSGDQISVAAKFNMETGVFQADSVPAGSYSLKAFSQDGAQVLRAETRLNVNAPVDNLRLALAPVASIPIIVRQESRNTNSGAPAIAAGVSPVYVHLTSTDPMGPELYSTMLPTHAGPYLPSLQNVDPGSYSASILPQGDWYIASAQYGQTNLLYDDLTIPSGGPGFPIEIVLHDDGATLVGSIKSSDGSPERATILVVPERGAKVNTKSVSSSGSAGFTVTGLAPGDYLVFAFDYADGLEYTNPEALQSYISQAAHVTLSPNQKSQVALGLIRREAGE